MNLISAYMVFDNYLQQFPALSIVTNKYFQAALIFLVFLILAQLFVSVGKRIIESLAAKTRTTHDDHLVELLAKPIYFIMIFIGLKVAVVPIALQNKFGAVLGTIFDSLIILGGAFVVSVMLEMALTIWGEKFAKKTKSTIDDQLIPILRKAGKVFIYIIAGILILSEWSINIGPFIASLGIAGLAIGFAIKDSLSNIFGGIQLILDKALKVGDSVEIDGVSGKVLDVGLRSTKIETWDHELMIFPNGGLANSRITNWKLPTLKARVVVPFGVEYGSDHKKVRKLALSVINKIDGVLDDPEPVVRFLEMGDSSLNFKVYFWVGDVGDRVSSKEKAVSGIYDILNKNKIGIPYPTRTVYNIKG
ncbi:mechanosensitive ion channel family protein [Candidatus Woesearchaeota archaeon]|jgi:MscS family membrane protein|nr:mechanosensitive ion channel family protein [Candidatus Woesearchaeota archaeon]MBT3537780.1 mechanosensitive ion channel family protein [Candidatus Woesearchaeota archaeon]MBT4697911.1 mechanosensitive ion channel family protein [Candidatus Woesearchaeota archaeon]MBT4717316.1 mechanosensitive ion channel family protein [Candidatus Woesearchaeota archaeon]MBT7105449.1 mechanosensitive ion channel family protein [Candidatus Woesearchaeota archaeon]